MTDRVMPRLVQSQTYSYLPSVCHCFLTEGRRLSQPGSWLHTEVGCVRSS